MDSISSRFRRTKRASPTTPPAGILSGSPPDKSSSESKLGPVGCREPPPTLTIPTNHASRNDLPSKSPFRRGFHFRHSHKRARSPTPASLPMSASPAIASQDSAVELGRSTPVSGIEDKSEKEMIKETPKPRIPAFLCQSQQDIEAKFHDLNWTERFRLQESLHNPSPNFKFARVTTPETKILDRYANIQPWANNRVKLQVPDGQLDYINASPITLRSLLDPQSKPPHHYIAMQGPKSGTMDHVWRMVVEQLQSPAVIVMLTETHEGGMEKCYPYFPRFVEEEPWVIGEDDEFGDGFHAEIKCVDIEEHANGAIEVRKLSIHVEDREDDMIVWHLLYRKWPDFGVPALEDIDSFFELMRLSREKNASEDNPRIIHCSAGVGRSGTFMALEHLMREIDSGDVDRLEMNATRGGEDIVYKTVDALREQRKQMVQAESQYLFIYQVLRKLWLDKHGLTEQDIREEPAAKRLEVDFDPFLDD
ncbi:Receptor-type tyrosine-protein phosphatase O [Daldinia childiae]|uniref:Receptor-type tyrosine-protein phosphatase O n=1 Tax=Daldinia childiae TaxID=326645 RepID=UPI0014467E67|nr:Receptor-type tyrosine-protein phosphatase O [Daldinia childiae]KAF3059260.1 Receptor-type tyrosine-protein phosphatase O [Daldinia childiae]